MRYVTGTYAKPASTGLAKGLVRAAAAASLVVASGVGSTGPSGLGLLGFCGLAITVATPVQARCLIGVGWRDDIANADCLEAQRTGCVRRMLTDAQYRSCLKANQDALKSGSTCVIGGQIRNDLSPLDCEEAKATGCVRRLLTDAQYRACLDAQRY
jgi:hypothetical protein